MTLGLNTLVLFAMAALLAIQFSRARRTLNWRNFCLEVLALCAMGVFLNALFDFPVPSPVISKSPEDVATVALLFISMVLGMLAQGLFQRFQLPQAERTKARFDWGLFLAPVCASPIVFIPLMVALQNGDTDLARTSIPRMMIFLVAFQNGFFWKEHFDRQREVAKNDKN